jgi:hypothetical protein
MLTNLYYLYYWFSVGEGTLPLHHLMAKISSRNHTPTSSAPRPDLKNISHTDAARALSVVPPSPSTIRRRKSMRRSEERGAIRGVTSSLKGLFGSGDIPKWLGVATEKLVAKCLVQRVGVVVDSQILGIYLQNDG